jgi:hypothetical protein
MESLLRCDERYAGAKEVPGREPTLGWHPSCPGCRYDSQAAMVDATRDPEAWWGLLEAVGLGLTDKLRSQPPDLSWIMDHVPGLDIVAAGQVRDAFARAFVDAAESGDFHDFLDRGFTDEQRDRYAASVMAHVHWPSGVARPADGGSGVAAMFVGAAHHWTFLWDEPMSVPQVDLWRNGMIDGEDIAFLRKDLAENGYRLVTHHPQGSGAVWDLVLFWLRDDLSHLAFDTFLTVSVQRIVKHFKDRGKPPPDRIVLQERGQVEPVFIIEVEKETEDET